MYMELGGIFVNIGDYIYFDDGNGGGGGIPNWTPLCPMKKIEINKRDPFEVKGLLKYRPEISKVAIITDINYRTQEFEIEYNCTDDITTMWYIDYYDKLNKKAKIIIKYDHVNWKNDTISKKNQIKNAITELLNMNLLNNTKRIDELKPKINKLFEKIDDPL